MFLLIMQFNEIHYGRCSRKSACPISCPKSWLCPSSEFKNLVSVSKSAHVRNRNPRTGTDWSRNKRFCLALGPDRTRIKKMRILVPIKFGKSRSGPDQDQQSLENLGPRRTGRSVDPLSEVVSATVGMIHTVWILSRQLTVSETTQIFDFLDQGTSNRFIFVTWLSL